MSLENIYIVIKVISLSEIKTLPTIDNGWDSVGVKLFLCGFWSIHLVKCELFPLQYTILYLKILHVGLTLQPDQIRRITLIKWWLLCKCDVKEFNNFDTKHLSLSVESTYPQDGYICVGHCCWRSLTYITNQSEPEFEFDSHDYSTRYYIMVPKSLLVLITIY